MLELRKVTRTVAGVDHIRDVSLVLAHGSLNVLLGPTLSGKTSLMRLMAGLDAPTQGGRSSRQHTGTATDEADPSLPPKAMGHRHGQRHARAAAPDDDGMQGPLPGQRHHVRPQLHEGRQGPQEQ